MGRFRPGRDRNSNDVLPSLSPIACGGLVVVSFVFLLGLLARFQVTVKFGEEPGTDHQVNGEGYISKLSSHVRSGLSQETQDTGAPFIQSPPPGVLQEYIDCILHPDIFAGNSSLVCQEFDTSTPENADVAWLQQFPAVLLDYSHCVPLAGFPEGDDREVLYDPTAVYSRPGTSDAYATVQVFCMEFHYLKLVRPYIPHDRPLAILDAGANAGFASVVFSRLMRFQGDLVSVEMNPASARMVRRNVAALRGVPGLRSLVVDSALVSEAEAAEAPEVTFMGRNDVDFMNNRLTTVQEHAGSNYSFAVPSVSLPAVLEMTEAPAFDFIKLDIEGAELTILQDPASRRVLCEARCVFAELHERYKAGIEAAWAEFVASGCPEGRRMRELTATGEYRIACREDL